MEPDVFSTALLVKYGYLVESATSFASFEESSVKLSFASFAK